MCIRSPPLIVFTSSTTLSARVPTPLLLGKSKTNPVDTVYGARAGNVHKYLCLNLPVLLRPGEFQWHLAASPKKNSSR